MADTICLFGLTGMDTFESTIIDLCSQKSNFLKIVIHDKLIFHHSTSMNYFIVTRKGAFDSEYITQTTFNYM